MTNPFSRAARGIVLIKLLVIGLLFVGLSGAVAWAQSPVTLTLEERAWIAANPDVQIGNPSLPPYHYTDNGRPAGYQVEIGRASCRERVCELV